MRHRTALKVKIGDKIHLKAVLGAQSYTVKEIDYGPGPDPYVCYPLFNVEIGPPVPYLLVRIVQNEKGQVVV